MVEDFNFPVSVKGVETVREENGLAMSSRNRRLSKEGLNIASGIFKGLALIGDGVKSGKEIKNLLDEAHSFYQSIKDWK